jgi:hypothetical protein
LQGEKKNKRRKLSLLQVCLEEEEDGVSTNAYPQGIILVKIEDGGATCEKKKME